MPTVQVNLGELRDAADYGTMRRAPKGAKGQIPQTTLLRVEGKHLAVDTPFLVTHIPIDSGRWPYEVSVNPKVFVDALESCIKLWKDVGGRDAMVSLSVGINEVEIRWTDGKSARSRTIPAGKSRK